MSIDKTTETDQLAPIALDVPSAPPTPGLPLISSCGHPLLRAIPVSSTPLTLGRSRSADIPLDDPGLSGKHVRIHREGAHWTFVDLGSRNRTYVDGNPISDLSLTSPRVLLIGETFLLPVADLGAVSAPIEHLPGGFLAGPSTRAVLTRAERAAQAGAPLLILGETGTGKEHVARWYHRHSRHARGPFIDVDVGAAIESRAAADYLGAVRGAHSTAFEDQRGFYEQAHNGVLFFDELGNMPLAVQTLNLRVLQERHVRPLGAPRTVPVDLDICSATNRDLEAMMAAGTFLRDLYFRLAHAVVRLPPLRDRREEIPSLIDHFVHASGSTRRPSREFMLRALLYDWPGNVRELGLVVERALRDGKGDGHELEGEYVPRPAHGVTPATAGSSSVSETTGATEATETIEGIELLKIRRALEANAFQLRNTARALGMSRTTLDAKMKKYGLKSE